MKDPSDEDALVKLDFRNVFNSLYCYRMLEAVRDLAPDICPLVYSTLYLGYYSLQLFWLTKTKTKIYFSMLF